MDTRRMGGVGARRRRLHGTWPAALALALYLASNYARAATLDLLFTPDPLRAGARSAFSGCQVEPGPPQGTLSGTPSTGDCHSGPLGYLSEGQLVAPAEFTSASLDEGLTLRGPVTIRFWYYSFCDPAVDDSYEHQNLRYELDELKSDDSVQRIASGIAFSDLNCQTLNESGTFDVGRYALTAGSRLRMRLGADGDEPPRGEFAFGGIGHYYSPTTPDPVDYSDRGVAFEVTGLNDAATNPPAEDPASAPNPPVDPPADPQPDSEPATNDESSTESASGGGGSLPPLTLLVLLLLACVANPTYAGVRFAFTPDRRSKARAARSRPRAATWSRAGRQSTSATGTNARVTARVWLKRELER